MLHITLYTVLRLAPVAEALPFTLLDRCGCALAIVLESMVVPKFKLVDVEMQVLLAHGVERPIDAPLDEREEPFDCVRVNVCSGSHVLLVVS